THAVIEKLDARRTQGGARLLLIVGASGAGKSSLLKAGVLPQLARRKSHWLALPPIRPERAPLKALAQVVAHPVGRAQDWRDWHAKLAAPEAVKEIAQLIDNVRIGDSHAACVLLAIDQFEEVFTIAEAAEREAFLTLLTAALDPARDLPV